MDTTTKVNKRFNPRNKSSQRVANYMGTVETITYAGACLCCGRTVYDGAGDPRGVTGPGHFNDGLEIRPGDGFAYAFPLCFTCDNEEATYTMASERARKRIATRTHDQLKARHVVIVAV